MSTKIRERALFNILKKDEKGIKMENMEKDLVIEKLFAIEEFSRDLRLFLTGEKAEEIIVPKELPTEATQSTLIAPVEVVKEEPVEIQEEIITKPVVDAREEQKKTIIEAYGLDGLTAEELIEILDADKVKHTKSKKLDYLINRVAEAVLDGEIPTDDEETVPEAEPEATQAELVAQLKEQLKEQVVEEPVVEEAEVRETPVANIMAEKEQEVEEEIRKNYADKKLKDTVIKKYLSNHYASDPDCKECNAECSKEEKLQCYIDVKKNLVDSEGISHDEGEAYFRNSAVFCCGEHCKQLPDSNTLYCEVCGEEYELED